MQETVMLVTAPAVLPVSVADMLLQCRVDADDANASNLMPGYIANATGYAEGYLKMSLVQRQYLWTLDYFPNRLVVTPTSILSTQLLNTRLYPYAAGQILWTPKPPLVSIDQINYLDTNGVQQTMNPSDYRVLAGIPGRVTPKPGGFWVQTQDTIGAINITLTCGYSADASLIPPSTIQAIKLIAAYEYRYREPMDAKTMSRVHSLLNVSRYGGYW